MAQQVTFALELPVEAGKILDDAAIELASQGSIEVKKPEGKPGAPGSALHFEPVTGAAIGWFIIKVGGDAAIALTAHLIADFVVKRLKGQKKVIPVRFPNGTIVELRVDDDASIRNLQDKIAEQAQS
jgi:hypothetical protein